MLSRCTSNGTCGNIGTTRCSTLAKFGHECRVFGIELVLLVGLHVGVASSSTVSSHVSSYLISHGANDLERNLTHLHHKVDK